MTYLWSKWQKHILFREVFVIYRSASKAVKQVCLVCIENLYGNGFNAAIFYTLFFLISCMMQAVHRHIPILVRTMGPSSDLLKIISDPPMGSEDLLMQVAIIILEFSSYYAEGCSINIYFFGILHQVLNTLTDGTVPSPELIFTIRKLHDSKVKVDHTVLYVDRKTNC